MQYNITEGKTIIMQRQKIVLLTWLYSEMLMSLFFLITCMRVCSWMLHWCAEINTEYTMSSVSCIEFDSHEIEQMIIYQFGLLQNSAVSHKLFITISMFIENVQWIQIIINYSHQSYAIFHLRHTHCERTFCVFLYSNILCMRKCSCIEPSYSGSHE